MSALHSRIAPAAMLSLVFVFAASPHAALAHERRDVGAYQFVVGWIVEPALEGQKNGVDLRVTKTGQPVLEVEKTLKVEVTQVEGGASKSFALRTIFNDPGHYTVDMIPTATGAYRFSFTGTVEGTNVNQQFTAGPGTFGLIEPTQAIEFPVALAAPRELQSAARGASDAAAVAADEASSARTLAIAGLGAGALGLVLGSAALMMAMRRTSGRGAHEGSEA